MRSALSLRMLLSGALITLAAPHALAAPGTVLVPAGAPNSDATLGEAYAVGIEHTVLSEERMGHEGRRLELRLLLTSDDPRDLYDLRVRLVGAGERSWLRNCKPTPARLRVLPSAAQKEITASFTCLEGRPSKDSLLREMQFRIEAVDLSTQAIVNFAATSREGN
jgi:hypothetical protein